MKRIIIIEWKGGIFNEMAIIESPIDCNTVFKLVDDGVIKYAEQYDTPIEKIEVNIFIKNLKG